MNNNKSNRLLCYFYLYVAFLFSLSQINAQTSSTPADRSTDQGNYIIENEVNYTPQSQNTAAIVQTGDENSATINQVREANKRGLNTQIAQYGYSNQILVTQQGGGQNFTAVQSGQDNYITSEINGTNQQVYLEQNGQSNKIYQELNGGNEGVFILTQQGADHEIYHTRQGDAPLLEIRQRGYGAKVRIEQQ